MVAADRWRRRHRTRHARCRPAGEAARSILAAWNRPRPTRWSRRSTARRSPPRRTSTASRRSHGMIGRWPFGILVGRGPAADRCREPVHLPGPGPGHDPAHRRHADHRQQHRAHPRPRPCPGGTRHPGRRRRPAAASSAGAGSSPWSSSALALAGDLIRVAIGEPAYLGIAPARGCGLLPQRALGPGPRPQATSIPNRRSTHDRRPRAPPALRAGRPVHGWRALLPDGRRVVRGANATCCAPRQASRPRSSSPPGGLTLDLLAKVRPDPRRRALPAVRAATDGRSSSLPAGTVGPTGPGSTRPGRLPGWASSPDSSTRASRPRCWCVGASRAGPRPRPPSATRRSAPVIPRVVYHGRVDPLERMDRPPLHVHVRHERLALLVLRGQRPRGRPGAGVRRPRGTRRPGASPDPALDRLRRPRLRGRRPPASLGRPDADLRRGAPGHLRRGRLACLVLRAAAST